MNGHLAVAAAHLLPTLLWGIIAWHLWRFHAMGLRGPLFPVSTLLALAMAAHFGLHALVALTPTELGGRAIGLHVALETGIDVVLIMSLAFFRHMLTALGAERPTARWLAANYGAAAVVTALAVVALASPRWRGAEGIYPRHLVALVYVGGMSVLALLEARRIARRGMWRPGPATAELRSPDVIVIFGAILGTTALLSFIVSVRSSEIASPTGLFVHTAMGVLLAVPFVVRMLGRVVRSFAVSTILIGGAAAVSFGTRAVAARAPDAEIARLVELASVAALLLLLVPGQVGVRAVVERIVFRRRRRREAALQTLAQRLSPELGVLECCRRALADLTRVMGLRGTAILLRDGGAVAHGDFRLDPVERVWPRGAAADALPARNTTEAELLAALPPDLRDALRDAEVTWIAPIASPRRRWGHLLATEWLLTTPSTIEDVAEIGAFVGQLALVLDASELLARAVAVERSLAHAEKLAAIGELTARIAHDIRNPVTAARSLAQQLASETGAPFHDEHALILEELERVERQVAALLRFARREELRLEPVDVGELVRGTLASFRTRLEQAGVALVADLAPQATAHVDREKVRQVVINLVENAIDALAESPNGRRLAVAVAEEPERLTLRVADSGPGIAPDDLPHLFEPFFSRKASGTGLGLAIARRTIEAHGGRITVGSSAGAGTAFEVELPRRASGEPPA